MEKRKKFCSLFILFIIVFSIVALIAETLPELMPDVDAYGVRLEKQTKPIIIEHRIWNGADVFCTLVFSAEYFLRLWVCNVLPGRTVRDFVTTPMNVCDLLAISPLYVEKVFHGSGAGFLRVLRAIRLVRLFRIFKLGRYSTALKLMINAIFDSVEILSVLLFFLAIGVILFSSIIYYFERISCPSDNDRASWTPNDWETYIGECDSSSGGKHYSASKGLCCDRYGASLDFPNILAAIWWNLVTMTTVGYGDIVPRTAQGQVVASLALLAGILLIALPVAVVGRKFQETYDLLEGDKAIEGTKQLLPPGALSGNLSDPTRDQLVFVKLVHRIQTIQTDDTDFFLKLKNLQRLIDQCVAAEGMVHRLGAAEKVRQQKLYFTFQKLLNKFLKEA